uniref:PSP1 C-terminal domain-containing protein n=1 Tax=Panagrellus redivivus TaxID=6233 RepID=A0A7E4W1J2_PANRE
MNGFPNFRSPVNRHPVDVFSAYDDDDEPIPYRSGRSSVPANLLHGTGGYQNHQNQGYSNTNGVQSRQQPAPPPRNNFAEVQNWHQQVQRQQQSRDSDPPWRQYTDFRPISIHGAPTSTTRPSSTTINAGRDLFDALLAPYNDNRDRERDQFQPHSDTEFGPSNHDRNNRGPQPYYPYRRSTSSLGDAKPKPVIAGLDPLRQTNREQLAVPLHIRNPFSTTGNESESINNAPPRPTHRTFSEPSNQTPHALDILSTSLYDPNSSYYNNQRNSDHFEPSPQTTRKFLNLKTSTRDQNRDYFDEDDFGGRFVAELLNDEMNKTTPTWKNSFAAKRDRFGAASDNEDMPAPFTHNYASFSSNGSATLPNRYRNGGSLAKSSSQNVLGNGSNTLGRVETSRSSSLLRDAVNRRTTSFDNEPSASATAFGGFDPEPTAKRGIGNFWIDTVRNRSASPSLVVARAPFKMTTAAERLEQLHEPVDGPDRSSYQNGHSPNGVDAFSSNQNSFSNGPAAYVASNIRRNGPDSVAHRRSQFSPEPVEVFNQGAKPFPSERFISERKVNGHAPNFASLDNAVADLRQNTHRLLDSSRGCARFPTTEDQFPSAASHALSRPVATFGTRMSPPRAPVASITRQTAHSPSPDSLSGESTTSLANLPHPRPQHNIREQLMIAGVGNTYLGPYLGRRPGTPIFPSPTNGSSVASRISAFEQKPSTPTLQLAVAAPSNSDAPRSPLSPRTTVFRKQAVIQYNNGHRGGATSPEYDNRRISTVSTSASFSFPTKVGPSHPTSSLTD